MTRKKIDEHKSESSEWIARETSTHHDGACGHEEVREGGAGGGRPHAVAAQVLVAEGEAVVEDGRDAAPRDNGQGPRGERGQPRLRVRGGPEGAREAGLQEQRRRGEEGDGDGEVVAAGEEALGGGDGGRRGLHRRPRRECAEHEADVEEGGVVPHCALELDLLLIGKRSREKHMASQWRRDCRTRSRGRKKARRWSEKLTAASSSSFPLSAATSSSGSSSRRIMPVKIRKKRKENTCNKPKKRDTKYSQQYRHKRSTSSHLARSTDGDGAHHLCKRPAHYW